MTQDPAQELMRTYKTLRLLVSVTVLWSALLCGLSGRSSATQDPSEPLVNGAQSSHIHADDGHGEPAHEDGHCDGDCDSPAGKSCPHAQVCCQTWALSLRIDLIALKQVFTPQLFTPPTTVTSFVAIEWRHRRAGYVFESPPPQYLPAPHGTRAPPSLA